MPESCRNLQDAGPDGHTQRPEARKVPDGFIYRRIRRFSTNAGRAVAEGFRKIPWPGIFIAVSGAGSGPSRSAEAGGQSGCIKGGRETKAPLWGRKRGGGVWVGS